MDANLAVVAVSAVALVGLFFAAVVWARGTRDSDVALVTLQRDEALALAEHRRLRLVEAAKRAVFKATGAVADAAHEASIGDALAAAGGDVDAAVERLLLGASGGRAPGPGSPADSPGTDAPASLDRGAAGVVGVPAGGPTRG